MIVNSQRISFNQSLLYSLTPREPMSMTTFTSAQTFHVTNIRYAGP